MKDLQEFFKEMTLRSAHLRRESLLKLNLEPNDQTVMEGWNNGPSHFDGTQDVKTHPIATLTGNIYDNVFYTGFSDLAFILEKYAVNKGIDKSNFEHLNELIHDYFYTPHLDKSNLELVEYNVVQSNMMIEEVRRIFELLDNIKSNKEVKLELEAYKPEVGKYTQFNYTIKDPLPSLKMAFECYEMLVHGTPLTEKPEVIDYMELEGNEKYYGL